MFYTKSFSWIKVHLPSMQGALPSAIIWQNKLPKLFSSAFGRCTGFTWERSHSPDICPCCLLHKTLCPVLAPHSNRSTFSATQSRTPWHSAKPHLYLCCQCEASRSAKHILFTKCHHEMFWHYLLKSHPFFHLNSTWINA